MILFGLSVPSVEGLGFSSFGKANTDPPEPPKPTAPPGKIFYIMGQAAFYTDITRHHNHTTRNESYCSPVGATRNLKKEILTASVGFFGNKLSKKYKKY